MKSDSAARRKNMCFISYDINSYQGSQSATDANVVKMAMPVLGVSTMTLKRLVFALFVMLIIVFAVVTAQAESWREYKLKYAGTVYLPPDWSVSFPPNNA